MHFESECLRIWCKRITWLTSISPEIFFSFLPLLWDKSLFGKWLSNQMQPWNDCNRQCNSIWASFRWINVDLINVSVNQAFADWYVKHPISGCGQIETLSGSEGDFLQLRNINMTRLSFSIVVYIPYTVFYVLYKHTRTTLWEKWITSQIK